MTEDPIRVLVVDDTVTYRRVVSRILAEVPGVEVVGTAANGKIALERIEQLRPDLLTLDLEMPVMDGIEVLRRLRNAESDVGAIMLSGATTDGAKATMDALKLGAFDFVLKPSGGSSEENTEMLRQQLGSRIRAFARSRQVHEILHSPGPPPPHAPAAPADRPRQAPPPTPVTDRSGAGGAEVVAVGISTGGPAALSRVLPQLPGDLRAPILVVQHMPPVFTKSLADDLNRRCRLTVCEASDGQPVLPAHVLIAPGGKQMKVEREDGRRVVRISDDPPENSCRPSVDYLFRSVVRIYGQRALGVIMTGMGSDGTRGCRELKRRGAAVLAQDETTCVVFGMPRGPIEEGTADVVAPLDAIASEIVRLTGKGALACK